MPKFGEKSGFSTNFCSYYSMAMWRLWAKKLINTISAEFGVFPSKNHDSIVFLCNSASNFQRKSQKIENNDNQIFYFIFCIFLKKNVELSSVFNAEMNSTCQNTLITTFLWYLEKKGVFLPNFCPYYGMAMWRLWAQRIDLILFRPNLASFHLKTMIPLFLCNSASNFQRKSQKIEKITIIRYFILFFAFFSKTVELSSVFNAEMNSTCQNIHNNHIFMGFGEKSGFSTKFLPLLQYGDVEAMGQKIDQYHFGRIWRLSI